MTESKTFRVVLSVGNPVHRPVFERSILLIIHKGYTAQWLNMHACPQLEVALLERLTLADHSMALWFYDVCTQLSLSMFPKPPRNHILCLKKPEV